MDTKTFIVVVQKCTFLESDYSDHLVEVAEQLSEAEKIQIVDVLKVSIAKQHEALAESLATIDELIHTLKREGNMRAEEEDRRNEVLPSFDEI
jgi:endonuclease IV